MDSYNISTPTYNATVHVNQTIASWFQKYEGQIVPQSFISGFIVLSYLVSFIGAWTTLELFNQRTGGRGVHNWNILMASSVSMGGVAIWCMHYIGNRALVLVQGQPPLQISYSAGYTVLSFFVPILVLLGAFMAIGSDETVSIVRVSLGGTLAGFAICGMHYLGQAGISNYTPIYVISNVIGSAIIAVAASIVALTVFFILRTTWSGSWWRRGLCAIVLAGAVSGMHWLATVGTTYRLKAPDWSQIKNSTSSRDSTTIVVAVLSVTACTILLAFTIVSQVRNSRSKNESRMVVLAAGIFDKDGRLLVTTEGLIPHVTITKQYVEHSFDDVFGISHPVYLWLFRTTRNWPGVASLIPGMRNHLTTISNTRNSRPSNKPEVILINEAGDPIEDYTIVFRELFCVAAADLADHLGTRLEDMGVLYDEIISTGQQSRIRGKASKIPLAKGRARSVDLERDGLAGFGRGQFLFLVKKADRREAEKLLANGYRFAGLNNIIDILARNMRVERADLAERLLTMRDYASSSNILEPGVHLACFAIRAHIGGVFDVLVRRDARNQLPTMQLPIGKLEDWQLDYLDTLEGKTVTVCLKVMKAKSESETTSEREKIWATQLYETLDALRDEIGESYFCDAKLISKPVEAPCRGFGDKSKPGLCRVIAFRIIVPINVRQPGPKLEFTPLKFLRMQQHAYPYSPDHAVWERKIYREFYPIMSMMNRPPIISKSSSSRAAKLSDTGSNSDTNSIDPLVKGPLPNHSKTTDGNGVNRRAAWHFWKAKSMPSTRGKARHSALGTPSTRGLTPASGIMVSSAVSVDINDKRYAKSRSPPVELSDLSRSKSKKGGGRLSPAAGAGVGKKEDPFGAPRGMSAAADEFDLMFGGAPHGKALGLEVDVEGVGNSVEVVREVCDPETFVDELMHVTIDKRNV